MATVTDVSSSLGEYMLKGWVLTDRICTKCARVPLMRSPSSAAVEIYFCVNCDSPPSLERMTTGPSTLPPSNDLRPAPVQDRYYSASATSNDSGMSRSSTPPTEVSNVPSSPILRPTMDTAELLRRRNQSDTASAEIGKRMLKGWAMLANECPSPNCYGIPLVRPPKTGATTDPRKECVICRIIYIDEKDVSGQDRLVPMKASPSPADPYRAPELAAVAQSSSSQSINGGKARANRGISLQPEILNHEQAPKDDSPTPNLSTSSVLEASAQSLERSLLVLSEHLNRCTAATTIDAMSIGQTADTISKVSQALTQVKQLLWSESRALLG